LERVYVGVKLSVTLFKNIRLLVKIVDIGLKGTVLLFCLYKGRDDFLDVHRCRARLLSNLLKGILYDFSIAHVLIQEMFLILIGGYDFLQS
jgi:hypothetical protein